MASIIGNKYGLLTVIEEYPAEKKKNRYVYKVKCICDCGNSHIVSTSDFKMKKVQSCGCLNSKGEQKIYNILEQNKIHFIKQHHSIFHLLDKNFKYNIINIDHHHDWFYQM